jgi:hypothetical protein
MTIDQNRQPAGAPVGGQFASASHSEPAIVLPVSTDEDVMDQIALMLGTVDQWDGSADYLEKAADLIAASGRPHPGDADPEEYRKGINALREARGRESTATETQLDNLALMLGTNQEWDGPAYLDCMADFVERSGRPHPGGSIDGLIGRYDALRDEA